MTEEYKALAFHQWSDDLARAFVRLEPKVPDETAPFRGRIETAPVGDIQVSRVTASSHKVKRLAEHIRSDGRDVCFINLQIVGTGRTRQNDHVFVSSPFDIAVVDTTEEFEISHQTDFQLFSVEVPRAHVPPALLAAGGCSAGRSAGHRELANALFSYASLALLSGQRTLMPTSLISDHIRALLGCFSSLNEIEEERSEQRGAKLSAMLSYLDRHLVDECLSAETMAQAFDVTPRYVHKLFSATGKTVSEHLCEMRILRAKSLLAHAAGLNLSITELAFTVGFRDISYFNRRFKQLTELTPSEFRQQVKAPIAN